MSIFRSIGRSISRGISRAIDERRKNDGAIVVPPDYWDLVTDLQPDIYYDFSNAASVTSSGGVVDAIANLGVLGSAGNWTSATTGRPTYDSTWKRAIFGASQYLGSADIAGFNDSGSLSVFIVFERRSDSGAAEAMFNQYRSSNNTRSFIIGFNSSDQLSATASTAGTADNTTLAVTNAAVELYDVNLLTWIYDPTNNLQTLRLNGNTVYSATTTAAAGLFNNTNAIGINLINSGTAGNFQGSIFTLAGYNRALTDAERDNVEGYLWTKWDAILADYVEAT